MDKQLVMQRFIPARGSTTSDSQFATGTDTAVSDNLAAIMKNNVVVFETPMSVANYMPDTPTE